MAVLKSDLSSIAGNIDRLATEAMLQTGADIVDILHQPGFVPRKTGTLQDSYKAEPVSSTKVIVGTDVPDYPPIVEFGSGDPNGGQDAQPHLTPAMMQGEPIFKQRLLEAVEKATND